MPSADALLRAVPENHRQHRFACVFCAGGVSAEGLKLLERFASPDRDIYQFGVYTGNGLRKLATRLPNAGHVYGFDSFEGIPPESKDEEDSWRSRRGKPKTHFQEGGYSAAAALNKSDVRSTMLEVAKRVGQPARVTLVPGYFNASLNDELLRRHPLRPALLVDVDSDIYLSAVQPLDWMFSHGLIVPGSFVRYDDWPRRNATFGPAKGTNYYGQARAHYEVSAKHDVRWKLVDRGMVQVLSVGAHRCEPRLCDRAPSIREANRLPPSHPANRDDADLLPLWSPSHVREGLS